MSLVDSFGLDAECTCKSTGITGGGGAPVNGVQPDKKCGYQCTCRELDCDRNPVGDPKTFTVEAFSSKAERTEIDVSKQCLGQLPYYQIAVAQGNIDQFEPFQFKTGIEPQPQAALDAFAAAGIDPPPGGPNIYCSLSPQLCALVDEQF